MNYEWLILFLLIFSKGDCGFSFGKMTNSCGCSCKKKKECDCWAQKEPKDDCLLRKVKRVDQDICSCEEGCELDEEL